MEQTNRYNNGSTSKLIDDFNSDFLAGIIDHKITQNISIKIPNTQDEWDKFHIISKKEVFSRIPDIEYDTNHTCFYDNKFCHFILNYGDQIAGMCIIEKLNKDNEWALRIIALDKPYQNKNIGGCFLEFIKTFIKSEGGQKIRAHANEMAFNFYKKHKFVHEKWEDSSINEGTIDVALKL